LGNGQAAHGQVRENRRTEFGYCSDSRTPKRHHAWNRQKNYPASKSEPTGKGTDFCDGATDGIEIFGLKML